MPTNIVGQVKIALRNAEDRRRPEIDDIQRRLRTLESIEEEGLYIQRDGSTPLTGNWDIGDGFRIEADEIRARDAAGLALRDDAGTLGVFVEDGGQVGIGTASPFTTGDIMLTVDGSIATATGGRVYLENATGNRGAQIINTAASGDSNIEFRTGDNTSPTTKMTLKKTGQVFFDGAVQDMISLFGDRLGASDMLGFGIESGAMYAKSGGTHRWYVNANADGGTSSVMDLDANYLTPFGGLGEAWNAPTFNTGWQNAAGGYDIGYRLFGDMVLLRGRMERTSGSAATAFTLPAGYRPSDNVVLLVLNSAGLINEITIGSGGQVDVTAGGYTNGDDIYMDGFWFAL